jgi:hypothetical protein
VWRPVPLPASTTDPLDKRDDFGGAVRLFEGTHQAWLMSRWGTTWRITFDGGTP